MAGIALCSGRSPPLIWEHTMDFSQFKMQYSISLDPQQEMAVQAADGPVLLLAVPPVWATCSGCGAFRRSTSSP